MARKDDELMSITEAAAAIGVSPATLRRAVRLGQCKGKKIGWGWVTTLRDAKAWLADPANHVTAPKKFRKLGD